jgi:hypothetical protein
MVSSSKQIDGWRRRPEGPLTIEEAIAFARSREVVIEEDVHFVVDDDFLKPADDAHYYPSFSSCQNYRWVDLLGPGERVWVRIRSEVLASDERTLHVFAHEMHEVNALRALFRERETIPGERLIFLVWPGQPDNLHAEANRVAGDAVLKLRKERQ